MSDEQKIHKAARRLQILKAIVQMASTEIDQLELNLTTILEGKSFRGLALVPGTPVCRPSWKEEWSSLCIALKKNPIVEEQKIKEKTGKTPGKPKLAIDAEFSPNEEKLLLIHRSLEKLKE
jgi:hypothetical protein